MAKPRLVPMKAKHNGECRACGAPIFKKEKIQWKKGVGAFCMHCDGEAFVRALEAGELDD